MRQLYFAFGLVVAFTGAQTQMYAQSGECQTGGCPNAGSQHPATTQTTSSHTWKIISTQMYAGEYAVCTVEAGKTYYWSLCQDDGGFASYDAQLTLIDHNSGLPICYSDDFCGNRPKITWQSSFTGSVRIRVNEYNCASNTSFTSLVWRVANTGADASVATVYTLGTLSTEHNNPHPVTARIVNSGTTNLTNLPVTFTVSGANSNTQTVTVPSLPSGTESMITFAPYNSTNTGTNNVMVSVPADALAANNSTTISQLVTTDAQGYSQGTSLNGEAGFMSGVGEYAAKFSASAATGVSQVKLRMLNSGITFRVKLRAVNNSTGMPGAVLYNSGNLTAFDGTNVVNINPVVAVPAVFFVSVEQVNSSSYLGLGFQGENPLRPETFYVTQTPASGTWDDISGLYNYRFMVDVVHACPPPATPAAISGSSTACAGTTQTYNVPAVSGATSCSRACLSGKLQNRLPTLRSCVG